VKLNYNKAIFFDRDGVINHLVLRNNGYYSPRFFKDFKLYDDVLETIEFLKNKSFRIIIISNQPDISRKEMSTKELKKIDDFLMENLLLDDIYYSFDSDVIDGGTKKPLPTMVLSAQKKWKINLSESYFVGDSKVDIECANSANVPFILIKRLHNKDLEYHRSINSLIHIKNIL
jgi:D-glycero-D-manno-heptose 1,7-bisphosphate phosphatase